MRDICVVIPAYEPGWELISLCESLYNGGVETVFLVDDGSGEEYRCIFEEIHKRFKYIIFRHIVNLGKGRALKDAFNMVLSEKPTCIGVVTADSDGQHTVQDIKRCMEALSENPDRLVLGCRNFKGDWIPWKSSFGNNLTRKVLSFLCGIKISDTQTGLRGIPTEFMKRLLSVKGERFEFETNMLLEWGADNDIVEVPIETVYDSKENHKTHFDPIRDSIRIYRILLTYGLSSLLSTMIDFIVFSIFTGRGLNIWQSTAIARACSAMINFTVNKKAVFKTEGNIVKQLIKYLLLVIISGTISATWINLISERFPIAIVVIKAVVETTLFFINYYIQRAYIFGEARRKK